MAERRLPRLHLVTDDPVLAAPGFTARARVALERGGAAVALHLRGPRAGGRALWEAACALLPDARRSGALLLVNDRVDVALAAGADGVQLGRRSLPPGDARRKVGPGRRVGATVGSPVEAREAAAGGADFLLAGNVFATASHAGRAGIGPRGLADLAIPGVPLVAIGGMTPERVGEVRAAGAHGVAAIRAVWEAADTAEAVARFLEALEDADD